MKIFAQRIRELRLERELEQQAVAEALKTTRTNVSNWETDRCEPDMKTIVALAAFFNTSADYLLGITDV